MNTSINKTEQEENKKEASRYPWEAMILLISIFVGGILMALKIIGII